MIAMLKFWAPTPPPQPLLNDSPPEATKPESSPSQVDTTKDSYNKPTGDGSLIGRPDVIRAVVTILVLINLASVFGFWRLRYQSQDKTLKGPLRFITDVNSAPASELSLLPGIGYELANRIVENRETDGPFRSIEDLNRVHGIGPKTIAQIEPMIVFGLEPSNP
jgi:competence ComEA-like helix-hairpin-helix protein